MPPSRAMNTACSGVRASSSAPPQTINRPPPLRVLTLMSARGPSRSSRVMASSSGVSEVCSATARIKGVGCDLLRDSSKKRFAGRGRFGSRTQG
jgi:hypothetical protein